LPGSGNPERTPPYDSGSYGGVLFCLTVYGFFLFLEALCLKTYVDDGIFLEGYGIAVSVRSSK
jgi:hypothetical protein